MTRAKSYRTLHERVVARPGAEGRLAKLREQTLAEIGVYELRRARELSQTELAQRLNITQSAVSKFEHADDFRVSTLRDYVEALGGRLELRAQFDDEDVSLHIGKTSR